jgi:diadenosine tetraphosphate (Ap4A) HIT family hydrolase
MPTGECPFCEPTGRVYVATPRWIAIPDRHPRSKEHVLLIPTVHVREFIDLAREVAAELPPSSSK